MNRIPQSYEIERDCVPVYVWCVCVDGWGCMHAWLFVLACMYVCVWEREKWSERERKDFCMKKCSLVSNCYSKTTWIKVPWVDLTFFLSCEKAICFFSRSSKRWLNKKQFDFCFKEKSGPFMKKKVVRILFRCRNLCPRHESVRNFSVFENLSKWSDLFFCPSKAVGFLFPNFSLILHSTIDNSD